jgi:hypothetical protein
MVREAGKKSKLLGERERVTAFNPSHRLHFFHKQAHTVREAGKKVDYS